MKTPPFALTRIPEKAPLRLVWKPYFAWRWTGADFVLLFGKQRVMELELSNLFSTKPSPVRWHGFEGTLVRTTDGNRLSDSAGHLVVATTSATNHPVVFSLDKQIYEYDAIVEDWRSRRVLRDGHGEIARSLQNDEMIITRPVASVPHALAMFWFLRIFDGDD